MIVLSVDTSTDVNTVALLNKNKSLGEISICAGKKHSERIIPIVQSLFDEVQLTIDDVNLLAVSLGPGSFTGLRIGLATWKGLAIAKNIPLVGVSTLDAMTRLAPFYNAIVCPILDARMKEVYAGIYQFTKGERQKVYENFLGSIEEFLNLLRTCKDSSPFPIYIFGEGANLYQKNIQESIPDVIQGEDWWSHPRATTVGIEALMLWEQGYRKDIDEILPIYLRLSQPEEKRRKCQNLST
ncbi:MAG TPA: tRNA (adenosine(37)-N6)-threonylcarbamoyltransferase complex dimerization subunit type 1 TsaB [Candidatus Hydrogenedens sp.]|nr:tRNA (adenosine(37)-N6)-threonylcarbamoyltransferase complex dimerization subunit type 1 TsaB [Candidatus Hydrogenedens sp.]HOK08521.1 tRNA (adenosine(37)-N6)-threonylcarbamoyltransferase complex dimerization subunit type 1 TsaB [Candidatus Hydrogenedens sp.]HOL19009.1 tRNA (adenosine(37)-N6)-threonylcarbamoyltransferase complex dimerization subunit type 1 TsaB [Candidatus Hydrogenedens sp.]HPP57809.1 tRNA (adenosine(37)-N6)-threonylcarbamoyltransferase complex dimerization subunit type 1 Tsa